MTGNRLHHLYLFEERKEETKSKPRLIMHFLVFGATGMWTTYHCLVMNSSIDELLIVYEGANGNIFCKNALEERHTLTVFVRCQNKLPTEVVNNGMSHEYRGITRR